jgi:hypothetical protein
LTVSYGGSPTYATSSSPALTYLVAKGASTTTATANKGTQTGHYTVVGVVKATAPAVGSPSGSVSFKVDNGTAQTATITAHHARLNAILTAGTHTVVLTYPGDPAFTASTTTLTVTV